MWHMAAYHLLVLCQALFVCVFIHFVLCSFVLYQNLFGAVLVHDGFVVIIQKICKQVPD